jgi:hypothetical protein
MIKVIRCNNCKKPINTQKCVKINKKKYHISCGIKEFKKTKK